MDRRSSNGSGHSNSTKLSSLHNDYAFLRGLSGPLQTSIVNIINGRHALKPGCLDASLFAMLKDAKRYKMYLAWMKQQDAVDNFLRQIDDLDLREAIGKLLDAEQYDPIRLALPPIHSHLLDEFEKLQSLLMSNKDYFAEDFSTMSTERIEVRDRREHVANTTGTRTENAIRETHFTDYDKGLSNSSKGSPVFANGNYGGVPRTSHLNELTPSAKDKFVDRESNGLQSSELSKQSFNTTRQNDTAYSPLQPSTKFAYPAQTDHLDAKPYNPPPYTNNRAVPRMSTYKAVAKNSRSSFNSKGPKYFNILILGETGVGKSTFVNSFVNFSKYRTLEDACLEEPEVLIRTSFVLTDDENREFVVDCKPTVRSRQWQDDDNEDLTQGQSATQKPRSYVFKTNRGEMIRLIDTPGIGDVRGTAKDRENFNSILTYISNFEELHAICILLKSNQSKLTISFRYCIDELLVNLHKSAAANIVFGFTHARETMYRPGDCLPILVKHLDDLKAKRGIAVRYDKKAYYMFEGESYRYLCASRQGFKYTAKEKKDFSVSWGNSVNEIRRLIEFVSGVIAHNTYDTVNLNHVRILIASLTRPLSEIIRNQICNLIALKKRSEEIKISVQQKKVLADQLNVETTVLRCVPCAQPKTVCTSKKCVTYHRMPNSSAMQIVYSTVCHENCRLIGVEDHVIANPDLKDCVALKYGDCYRCGCSWKTHMHIRYNLESYQKQIIDSDVKLNIQRTDSNLSTARVCLDSLRTHINQVESEWQQIVYACAMFAVFLKMNSHRVEGDPFAQYLQHLIDNETDIMKKGDSLLATQLKGVLNEYFDTIKIQEVEIEKSPLTAEKVDSVIEGILNMPLSGDQVRAMVEIDLQAMKSEMIRELDPIYIRANF